MNRSWSHSVWAIIMHMIIIILSCLLIIAISPDVLARWSHLICLCKDHSKKRLFYLLEEEACIIQMKNKLEKRLICHRVIRPLFGTLLCCYRSSSRARWDTEGPGAVFFYPNSFQTAPKIFHPLNALCSHRGTACNLCRCNLHFGFSCRHTGFCSKCASCYHKRSHSRRQKPDLCKHF